MAKFVITGTGIGVGKTVFAAGLTGMIGADYWKPVQTGLAGPQMFPRAAWAGGDYEPVPGSDADFVRRMTGARVHPEAMMMADPLSPHRAAELAGVVVNPAALVLPGADPLVIEGMGGVMVPLNRQLMFADLFVRWGVPVIVVAQTGRGTISHTVTAMESLAARHVPVHGLAFVGDDNPDNIAIIAEITGARVLGRLPSLDRLEPETIAAAMRENFDSNDFS